MLQKRVSGVQINFLPSIPSIGRFIGSGDDGDHFADRNLSCTSIRRQFELEEQGINLYTQRTRVRVTAGARE